MLLWRLLEDEVTPDVRIRLIHRIAPSGVAPNALSQHLAEQSSSAVRYGILLALGEYETFQTTSRFRESVASRVKKIHKEDPDSGVHSAAKWLLQKWGIVRDSNPQPKPFDEGRDWLVEKSGQTMIVAHGPVLYTTESRPDETTPLAPVSLIEVQINHSFAVADTEVTVREYERFSKSNHDSTIGPDPDCPVNNLTFNEFVAYCRWLTIKDGMTEDDMCFPPVDVKAKEPVIPYEDFLSRSGYRPPTEAEWEYVCRAGSVSDRFTGSSAAILKEYAWFVANSDQRSHSVGILKPNRLGLFDIYGNLAEMVIPSVRVAATRDQSSVVVTRGGSFRDLNGQIRSATRLNTFPRQRYTGRGARVARTLSPS